MAATVLAAGLLASFSSAAEAQIEDTGASATKVCAPAVAPDFYTIGEDNSVCGALREHGTVTGHGD